MECAIYNAFAAGEKPDRPRGKNSMLKKKVKKALKAVEKAVRTAVRKGVTEKAVERAVEQEIVKVSKKKKGPAKKRAKNPKAAKAVRGGAKT
jgi:hypothetical protein